MSTLSDQYLFVVAIDFGTTYSGYAFSSINDFKTDPLKISSNQAWNAGSQQLLSMKTPTCILLDKQAKFVSFGYEAENAYSTISLEGQQNEYLFFERFKMQLNKSEHIRADMMIEDVTGKPLKAMKVFAESMKALMTHFFDTFHNRGVDLVPEEIRWVLTVPAIWTDAAKQFMRKSANLAGIADNQLIIALEPEAASIYCQYLPTDKLEGAKKGFIMSRVGTQYMVVDNGGGTVDITVHEKLSDGALKEVCRASGGDCGGTYVDMAFYKMFENLVGRQVMNIIKKEDTSVYLDILREFESVKRTIDPDRSDKVKFTFPRAMLDEMCTKHLGKDFVTIFEQSEYKDKLSIRYDKMRIDPDFIKNLFKDASKKIVEKIKQAIKNENGLRLGLIVLVGGFSQCRIIQNEIKTCFPSLSVVVPNDAGIAVVKGAVLFGHRPDFIISRISRFTYGIAFNPPFDPKKYDAKKKMVSQNGQERCSDVFSIFFSRGQEIQIGTQITRKFFSKPLTTCTTFSIFKSDNENPKYIDEDGCKLIGKLSIRFSEAHKERRDLLFEMIFGHTELAVCAYDVKSGQKYETTFELI